MEKERREREYTMDKGPEKNPGGEKLERRGGFRARPHRTHSGFRSFHKRKGSFPFLTFEKVETGEIHNHICVLKRLSCLLLEADNSRR